MRFAGGSLPSCSLPQRERPRVSARDEPIAGQELEVLDALVVLAPLFDALLHLERVLGRERAELGLAAIGREPEPSALAQRCRLGVELPDADGVVEREQPLAIGCEADRHDAVGAGAPRLDEQRGLDRTLVGIGVLARLPRRTGALARSLARGQGEHRQQHDRPAHARELAAPLRSVQAINRDRRSRATVPRARWIRGAG